MKRVGVVVAVMVVLLFLTVIFLLRNSNFSFLDELPQSRGTVFGERGEMDWRGASLADDPMFRDEKAEVAKKAALIIENNHDDDSNFDLQGVRPMVDWVKKERLERETEILRMWGNVEIVLDTAERNRERIAAIEQKLDLILQALQLDLNNREEN